MKFIVVSRIFFHKCLHLALAELKNSFTICVNIVGSLDIFAGEGSSVCSCIKAAVGSTHKGTVTMALIKIPDKAMDKVDSPHLAVVRQELFCWAHPERISKPLHNLFLKKWKVLRELEGVGILEYLNCMCLRRHELCREQKVDTRRLSHVHKA